MVWLQDLTLRHRNSQQSGHKAISSSSSTSPWNSPHIEHQPKMADQELMSVMKIIWWGVLYGTRSCAFLEMVLYLSPNDNDHVEQASCIEHVKISSYIGIARHLPFSEEHWLPTSRQVAMTGLWWAGGAFLGAQRPLQFYLSRLAFYLNLLGVCCSFLPGKLTI